MKTTPLILLLGSALVSPSLAQVFDGLPEPYFTEMASGFSQPVGLIDGGGAGLLVVEQRGRIERLEDKALFIDLSDRVSQSGGERGLLGMAVPPGFGAPGKRHFYVNYTQETGGDTVVARYLLEEGSFQGDPASEEILLTIDQPFTNHNAGDMNFGPDGFLYIATGDGGSGNDPGNEAQDLSVLLGKMLRIDVEGTGPGNGYAIPGDNPFAGSIPGRDEIWAFGLRNPWRFSFDRATGDLWIADVGQNTFEEVDYLPAGTGAGSDFGWDYFEANFRNTAANNGVAIPAPDFADTVAPVFHYDRSASGGVSVTGGFVYRGDVFPRMQGRYFVTDFASANFWAVSPDGAGGFRSDSLPDTPSGISSFGEDAAGEMYLVDLGGQILRLEDTIDQDHLSISAEGPDEAGIVIITFGVEEGATYELSQSDTLDSWTTVGEVITATREDARSISVRIDTSDSPGGRTFFRAARLDDLAN